MFFFKPDENYGYFCQWYMCPITEDGKTFNCCEQYMMYHKAATFGDDAIMAAILAEPRPTRQKGLGKEVKGFVAEDWDKVKYDIVLRSNMLKFGNGMAGNGDNFVYGPSGKRDQEAVSLREVILATGERVLAEASRFDRVWGIGFTAAEAQKWPRQHWGDNLLGKVLMEVRNNLRAEEGEQGAGDVVVETAGE